MEILDILGVGASVASGGLFGVLGAAFGSWMKSKEKALEFKERIAEREYQKDMFRLRMEGKSQEGSWNALETSLQAEASTNVATNYRWVSAVKALFRPFITTALWVVVGWEIKMMLDGSLTTMVSTALDSQAVFDPTEIVSITKYIIYSTVFSATTATTWWFGERSLTMPEFKNR
jgi:hypothetical protein